MMKKTVDPPLFYDILRGLKALCATLFRVPNTTGVPKKSLSGNFFKICLVKERKCWRDFFLIVR